MDHEQSEELLWIEKNFPILQNELRTEVKLDKTVKSSRCVRSLVFHYLEKHIRSNIVPEFWSNFKNIENEQLGFELFGRAVETLYSNLIALKPNLEKLVQLAHCDEENCTFDKQDVLKYFKLMVRSILLSQIPLQHEVIVHSFYKIGFNVFCNDDSVHDNLADSSFERTECAGCNYEQTNCQCQMIVHVFYKTNCQLIELELIERLVGNVLTSLIHVRIKNQIALVCDRNFDVSKLSELENWIETVVMNWLRRICSVGYSKSDALNKKNVESTEKLKRNLLQYMYEMFTKIRIDQLFNIIIEYPESQPTIEDLKSCLSRTDLRKHLSESLKNALKTRLLHTGVNTQDILTAYVTAIKSLRQLDSTGVLLEAVTEPIRLYLRSRDDTVRCVVSGLLDESPSDLADELIKGESLQTDLDLEENTDNWNTWMPDPVDADPAKSCQRRVSDIISMLVNIYGSQDLFVNEYRTLLADRLLSQLNYHTEREIRHLELLKRRFGEHQLHFCEVMLKDVYDSKRIDGNIQSDSHYNAEADEFATSALILSAQFWPPFKEDWKLELPAVVQNQLDKYVKAFEALKGNRTLCWKSHLGSVDLEIQLKDRTINMSVTPVHATIILHFQDKEKWTVAELANTMHIPTTILQRKIAFWVSHGLLKNVSDDTYVLEEEYISKSRNLPEVIDDEEVESVMTSASDQREEELQVFWSYIVGMLTNLDSMPLERIHQMLKMFASQGSGAVECSLSELRTFLDRKVREHQLIFTSGLYRLPK